MKTCTNCGAQNDDANRFCDQCGTRLETAAPSPVVAPAAVAATPAAPATSTCPNCGAAVLPGEAFCDECGAALATPVSAPPAASETPGAVAPSPAAVAASPSGTATGTTCPMCGYQNMPGDRFCENCGADLTATAAAPAAAPAAVVAEVQPDATTAVAADTTAVAPPAAAEPAVTQPDAPTVLASVPVAPPVEATPAAAPAEVPAAPAVAAEAVTPSATPVEAVAPPAAPAEAAAPPVEVPVPPAAPAPVASEERQRIEQLIVAHRDTIAQYEQMLARYPAGAAPAFLTAGLDEARRALAQAEADLAALPSGVDPAELARLQDLAAAHRDTIAQYEQMLARYPAGAAPAFLTAGLDEARRALTQTEAELVALGVPVSALPAAPAAPVAVPAPTPAAPELATAVVPPPAAPAAAPAPAPAGPRLVLVEGGHVLRLPSDKTEIIVGREDPVSSIFPEIDLTPYGGETGGVSRQHARLSHAGGSWSVTDLNSTNYTRVDGTRIEPNTPTPIADGVRLQFGRIAMVFHL